MTPRCKPCRLPHRSQLDQSCFSGRSSSGSPSGSCRTTAHATWSTPRRGAGSVPRNHPTPAPGSPARRQAAEVKMVECITIVHGIAQRLSEKWRHFACISFVTIFVHLHFVLACGDAPMRLLGRCESDKTQERNNCRHNEIGTPRGGRKSARDRGTPDGRDSRLGNRVRRRRGGRRCCLQSNLSIEAAQRAVGGRTFTTTSECPR